RRGRAPCSSCTTSRAGSTVKSPANWTWPSARRRHSCIARVRCCARAWRIDRMKPAEDFRLRRELRTLRTDRPPARDLWPDIRSRLAARPSRSRAPFRRWSGALAAGVLLALVAAVSFRITGDGDAPPVPAHAGADGIDAGRPDDAAETLLS